MKPPFREKKNGCPWQVYADLETAERTQRALERNGKIKMGIITHCPECGQIHLIEAGYAQN